MIYSMDLRIRVVAALDQGLCITEVARRFQVGRATAREWQRRRDEGQLEPGKPGPKWPHKITPADDALICQAIKNNPGVTATEIRPFQTSGKSHCPVDEKSLIAKRKPARAGGG